METWYRVLMGFNSSSLHIEQAQVNSYTEKSVTYMHYGRTKREMRSGQCHHWFQTLSEAQKFIKLKVKEREAEYREEITKLKANAKAANAGKMFVIPHEAFKITGKIKI